MAYTPLKISIADPCHEDWIGMHPVAGTTARHCDSCAKNVVDFTGFSDVQMHTYVREQGGKLCGRFRPDQLDRPLRAVSTPTRNPLKVAAAAAGLLLATTGCNTPKSVSKIVVEQGVLEMNFDGPVLEAPAAGGISYVEVESPMPPKPEVGHVTLCKLTPPPPPPPPLIKVDEFSIVAHGTKGETPDEAPVIATEEFIVGDIDLIELVDDIEPIEEDILPPVPLIEQDTTPTSGKVITSGQLHNLPTRDISSHQVAIMGMVAMDHPRPTGMDWVKDTLKNVLPSLPTLPSEDPSLHQRPRPEMPQYLEALTVYPNPFVDHLKIDINLPAGEILTVELLDPTGRLVFAQVWKASAGANTLTIEPKQRKLKHAIYYLRVTDEQTFSVVKTVVK